MIFLSNAAFLLCEQVSRRSVNRTSVYDNNISLLIALRDSLTHRPTLQLPPTQAYTSTDYTEAFISLLLRDN